MTNNKNQNETIDKLRTEIDKMNLLIHKMSESLQNPFLNVDLRFKYKAAIQECEKKVKMFKGDIKAIEILNTMDTNNVELPKHYQHHAR